MTDDPLNILLEQIDRLTQPIRDPMFQDVIDDRGRTTTRKVVIVHRRPLLDQLRTAILGTISVPTDPVAGSSSGLGGLNVGAFEMYEDIDGRIRAMYRETANLPPSGDPETLLRAWYVRIRNLHMSNVVGDDLILVAAATVRSWVRRIEAMFDPEVVKELTGPCPGCATARWADKEGHTTTALYLHYKDSFEPEAICRSCGWNVSGPRGLLELGYHLGAVVDEEALKEMGVIV